MTLLLAISYKEWLLINIPLYFVMSLLFTVKNSLILRMFVTLKFSLFRLFQIIEYY